jgi:hypothetical protein
MVDIAVEVMTEDRHITTEVAVAAEQAAQVNKDILVMVEMEVLATLQIFLVQLSTMVLEVGDHSITTMEITHLEDHMVMVATEEDKIIVIEKTEQQELL